MQIKSAKAMLLLEVLQELAPDSSKNTLRSWIEQGRVSINGKKADKAKTNVEQGAVVEISSKPKFLSQGLKIVYEDTDLVIVDKPANLLSVATQKESWHTVHAQLKRRFHTGKVYPIHRLDKETSGLLVFAYTEKARHHLKEQLEKRSMQREYRAVVHGNPGSGTWKCYLAENIQMVVYVSDEYEGKEAITHFETIKQKEGRALLHLRLQTGRKHQIRVQAADAGFPILGDSKYGADEQKDLLLRAVSITFCHPTTGKKMNFSVDPIFDI